MNWNWERFQRQLAQEAREYLADLREIRDSLRYIEGWIALALVTAALLMLIAWAFVTLGFNPANDRVSGLIYQLGLHSCRPISNLNGVIVIIDALLLVFLTVVTLGSVMNQMERVRKNQRREPRELISYASMMLVVGLGGIVYMLLIC